MAGIIALASAAWACTGFKGQIRVRVGNSNLAVATGDPSDHMILCTESGTPYMEGGDLTKASNFYVKVDPAGISGVTGQQFCETSPDAWDNHLPDDDYAVYWTARGDHCMFGTGNEVSGSGFSTTDGVGTSPTIQIPSGAPTGQGTVCVSDDGAAWGIEGYVDFVV